ncbi:hypothetical protein GGI07_001541 [Coemansia sp. Benny D115]|nr:hypothetical protein GGI07_001541 [Coemansia sp. Benny D115]
MNSNMASPSLLSSPVFGTGTVNMTGNSTANNPTLQNPNATLSIALTRSQYAIECGGVLIDPSTNEVCLLFYPDTSEWRLPMGRPNSMAAENSTSKELRYSPAEHTVAGCEPPAHAAQRQISAITGYNCSHLHPAVVAQATENPCAYMGPQMVEPLALQIEQRVVPQTALPGNTNTGLQQPALGDDKPLALPQTGVPTVPEIASSDVFSPLADFHDSHGQRITLPQLQTDFAQEGSGATASAAADGDDDNRALGLSDDAPLASLVAAETDTSGYNHRHPTCQYVMTYYYMAWLTQSRFEQKAATHPVGLAGETAAVGAIVGGQPGALPLSEVTWFKMDTAAQVLTHESDKMALREAIYRLSRYGAPRAPFCYSAAILNSPPQGSQVSDSKEAFGGLAKDSRHNSQKQHQHQQATVVTASLGTTSAAAAAATTDIADSASASANSSSDSSSAASSDGATKAETAVVAIPSRNMDLIRKTATSLGKRGGMLMKAARQGRASTNIPPTSASAHAESASQNGSRSLDLPEGAAQKKPGVTRVLSLFYKMMGSSA